MARDASLADQISAVREFNRFYTAKLGLLRKRHLDGEFSLTEARILYEIEVHPQTRASALCATLGLDAGYISRLLTTLTRRRLIRQAASTTDGRERLLSLTAAGKRSVAHLNALSDLHIREILADLDDPGRSTLVASLAAVRRILSTSRELRIERLTQPSEEALEILREYYEAVRVVQRDKPGTLESLIAEPASGIWLAWLGKELVGCVVLRKLQSIPHTGECKRLFVRPAARGKHVASLLLDALEEFARSEKLKWIYLDTYDDLKPAINLYERRGYERCDRYNDNPQATLFMRKRIG